MSDTIYSEPGKVAYSEFDNAPTGLIGTVGYQIIAKSDDSIVQVRTTSDIVEAPTLSGRYKAKFLAPDDEGAYTILWDVGEIGPETTATDDLFVTGNLAALIEGEEGKILSLAEYKTRRQLTEVSLERDDAIRAALASAEDAILQYTGRDFTTAQAEEIREFPWEIHTTILETDDFVGKPSKISFEAPGVGGATAFPTSAYWLGPREGQTYYYIDFTPARNLSSGSIGAMGFTRNLDTYFGRGGGVDVVTAKVTAKFGWPGAAPPSIKQAVTWLVDEFYKKEGTQGELQAEAIANLSYVYQRAREEQHELPARVMALLDPYRRIAL